MAIQLFIAAIIASSMAPMVDYLTVSERARAWRWRPPVALVVLGTYAAVGLVLLVLGAVILRAVVPEIISLLQALPQLASAFRDWLGSLPIASHLDLEGEATARIDELADLGRAVLLGILGAISFILPALGGLLSALFVMMMALYLTVGGGRIANYLIAFIPPDRQPQVNRVIDRIAFRLGRWVQGQLLMCLIVGGGAWLGLQLIGVPYAALLGVVWAFAEFIPGVGPFISAIPSIALAFTVSPVTGVLAAVFCLAWSQVESNFITPKVMGDAVELNPLVVLLALLIGSELLGLVGALVGIPLAAAIATIVDELREEQLRTLASIEPAAAVPEEGLRVG